MAEATKKLRVLWVEDEPLLIELFEDVLVKSGLDKLIAVTYVVDGDTAIQRFEEIAPHFFITDFAHPGVNGEGLLEFLTQKHFPHPVVYFCGFVTNAAELMKRFKSLNLTVLLKPEGAEKLLGMLVMAAVKRRREAKDGCET